MQDKVLSISTLVPTSRVDEISAQLWELGILGLQELPPDTELYEPQAGTEFREPQSVDDWTRDERLIESLNARLKIFLPDSEEIFALVKTYLDSMALPLLTAEEIIPREYIEEYRKRVQGREFGNGLWVGPPWAGHTPDDHNFIIDPGMAFGTGEHPTTQMIIEWLSQNQQRPPLRILDIGTGSGILAIAAARFFPQSKIIATDIDTHCSEELPKNLELNQIAANRVEIHCGENATLERLIGGPERYDLILSNIYGEVLAKLSSGIKTLLSAQGTWVATGVLDGPARQVFEAAIEKNFEIKNRFHRRDAVPNEAHLWLCYELSK